MVAAATLANIGCHWLIAWRRSIGSDSFSTPPHLAIYLCGVLAAIACGYLILATTYSKASYPKPATVRIGGFRGPLGAFVSAWGVAVLIGSGIFDSWWHESYGINMKILIPPHVLFLAGLFAIQTGALVMVIGFINREAQHRSRYFRHLTAMRLYIGSMMLILIMVPIAEFTVRPYQHSSLMYCAVSMVAPAILAGLARANSGNWAATFAAAGYSIFCLTMLWMLPLFPATPAAGPVFSKVTHMIPMEFPLLLIVPAIAMDLLYLKIKRIHRLLLGTITGVVFLGVFVVAQWEFAGFLQSPGARNWFFGAGYVDFSTRPDSIYALHKFVSNEEIGLGFDTGMWLALACAIVSSWLGLTWGNWMRRIRR
jgi:hypothetical protein